MAVNLHQAQKTDLHAAHETYSCVSYHHAARELLLTCSTQKVSRMQYTKFDSHVAHFVSHACFDSSHNKIEEHTRVHHMQVST